jgi:WD40 repeat protein
VELHTLRGHTGEVNAVAVTADGRMAVSASNDRTLKVWDLDSGAELHTLRGHAGGLRSVALTADGRRAVSAAYDYTLKVWDLGSGTLLATIVQDTYSTALAITEDGSAIIVGDDEGDVHCLRFVPGRG